MSKKIKDTVTSTGVAANVSNATPMASGKTYVRNPKNPQQMLEVQGKEGNQFRCFPVISKDGATVTVDSTKQVYISEDYEADCEKI